MTIIILVSVLIQISAAYFALQLIRITGKKYAWFLICIAIILMAGRRLLTFCHDCFFHDKIPLDFTNDITGLIISLLILLGVLGIKKIFIKQHEAEKILHEFNSLKISALESKLSPHFLFNTLNSIACLMTENPIKAEKAIHDLSDIYRYLVDMIDNDMVTMEEGIRILKAYFELQQLRFGDRITLDISIDGDSAGVYLPGLILQPIVENSIRHGFGPRGNYGKVTICITVKNKQVRISIHDDGVGCADTSHPIGHGLKIIRARLEHCYDNKFTMEMQCEKDKGTTTTITLPIHSLHNDKAC